MPEILPPYQVETPEYVPGMSISVQPPTAQHARWLDDYEYYDQLGRDPFQVRRIWGISDPQDRVNKVKEILEEFKKQMHRRQMLLTAAARGDEDVVRCIVETGVKVHPDIEKAQKQEKEEEEELEENDEGIISLPDKDDPSCAPVHFAALHGHVGVLEIFLKSGIEVDVRDEFGRTPFLAAASRPHTKVMEYLVAHGADPAARCATDDLTQEYMEIYAGANALELVAQRDNVDLLKWLLDKPGVSVTPLAITSSVRAPRNYGVPRLLLERGGCLAAGSDELIVNDSNKALRQAAIEAIPMAIQQGELSTVKLFMGFKYPAFNNGDLSDFQIPQELHKPFTYGAYNAICNDQTDKFEFLYSLGIEEHDTMSLDDLPKGQHLNIQHLFDEAATAGSINCARLLIEKYDASPHTYRIPSGTLPLYFAAGNDQPAMVRYLLEKHNTDIQISSGSSLSGPTALWIAIKLKSLESVALILRAGGPINHIDDEIANIDAPLHAVLIAHMDSTVSFQTEEHAQSYIDGARKKFENPNSPYVRVVLGLDDRAWIETLQHRKSEEELRAADRRRVEAIESGKLDLNRDLVGYPTFEERAEELMKVDDLLPLFKPAFKAVS
jgi:ankyrin repeat protein